MSRLQRVTAIVVRLFNQAMDDPYEWYSELNNSVRCFNDEFGRPTWEVKSYYGRIVIFHALEPAMHHLLECIVHEAVETGKKDRYEDDGIVP